MKNFPLDLNKVKEHFYYNPKVRLVKQHGFRFEYECEKNISFDTDWRDITNLLYNLRLKYVERRFPAQLRISFDLKTNYYLHSVDFNATGRKVPGTNIHRLERSLLLDSNDTYLQLRGSDHLAIPIVERSHLVETRDFLSIIIPIWSKT